MLGRNGDVVSSLESMRAVMAGKAMNFAQKMTAPVPQDHMNPRAMITDSPSHPPHLPENHGACRDDATIMIQPAPSPPVVELERGGVSRDWSIIFEVLRDEYKEQVNALLSGLEGAKGSGVKVALRGVEQQAMKKNTIEAARDPVSGPYAHLLQMHKDLSQVLGRGQIQCSEYAAAHARACDSTWRSNMAEQRAQHQAESHKRHEQTPCSPQDAASRPHHKQLDAHQQQQQLILARHQQHQHEQQQQASTLFTRELLQLRHEQLKHLDEIGDQVNSVFGDLQAAFIRLKTLVERSKDKRVPERSDEDEGVTIALTGMLQRIANFLQEELGPFRSRREVAKTWLRESEERGGGRPSLTLCQDETASEGAARARKGGPPARPPPPVPDSPPASSDSGRPPSSLLASSWNTCSMDMPCSESAEDLNDDVPVGGLVRDTEAYAMEDVPVGQAVVCGVVVETDDELLERLLAEASPTQDSCIDTSLELDVLDLGRT